MKKKFKQSREKKNHQNKIFKKKKINLNEYLKRIERKSPKKNTYNKINNSLHYFERIEGETKKNIVEIN